MSTPDFREIAYGCQGMLAPAIYKKIYQTALTRSGGSIVEVGTARGAATVALALGIRDSGKPGEVITFGRSVRRVPGETGNPVEKNFERFGVTHLIKYYEGMVEDLSNRIPAGTSLGVLMLDADGCIDRDFNLFYDRLVPAAPIIIDDCRDTVRIMPNTGRGYRVDSKMRLTYFLVKYFREAGFITQGGVLKDTYFCQKGIGAAADFDNKKIIEVYRSLIFTTAANPLGAYLRRSAISALDRLLPRFSQKMRVSFRDRNALG